MVLPQVLSMQPEPFVRGGSDAWGTSGPGLHPVCVWGLCTVVGARASLSNLSLVAVTQDLLKHTPAGHPDYPLLQDALRISQNFLSSINEEITPRRQSMTVKKGEVSMARGGWAWPSL